MVSALSTKMTDLRRLEPLLSCLMARLAQAGQIAKIGQIDLACPFGIQLMLWLDLAGPFGIQLMLWLDLAGPFDIQ